MGSVIVAGARTGMGKLLGSLKGFSAMDLGGFAIKGAMDKAGIAGAQVDYVIMGQVIQAGCGQNPARIAATNAGLPMSVPTITINKVCLSGIAAIAMADSMIRAGDADVVIAGGMESMTNAPHYLPKSRDGYKYGDVTMKDTMANDGLWDYFTDQAMGLLTETANGGSVTREEQDAFGVRSHQRAALAQEQGIFADEIVPVAIPQRKGDPVMFATDEGVRGDTTLDSLAKLRPAFAKDGTITAGQSSPISDGGCALVIMSEAKAAELGCTVLAKIGAYGNVAGPDSTLQLQPAQAIKAAAAKQGIAVSDIDVFE
ncbi:MAG: acetyl-CoA C-acyltransferase, partial [Propionibacteriaceae bacterium]